MLASLTARAMAFLYVAPEYQNGHPLEHHGYNRLVPLVVLARLAGDVQAAVEISHFEHLIAQNDLLLETKRFKRFKRFK
jgi:hypothetical protein